MTKKLILIGALFGMNAAFAGGTFKLKDHIDYKFGGRLMLDAAYHDDDKEDLSSGTEVRRARLYFAGKLKKNWDFIIQTDFAGNGVAIKAAHIGYSWANSKVTLGNQLPPFSLQLQTSSKHQTFITRANPVLAWNPDNSFGLSYKTSSDNIFFKTGIYGDTANKTTNKERFIYGARLTTNQMFGNSLNHFGLSYLFTAREEGAKVNASGEFNHDGNNGYDFIDTDSVGELSSNKVAVEYAYVNGSFSFQTEYLYMDAKVKNGSNSALSGWYAFMSWFPTGDTRNYSKGSGAFSIIKPKKELGEGGMGAIETAVRYSNIDLTGSMNGGEANNIAAEVNWYPGGGLKFMLNHTMIFAEKDNVKDEPMVTQFRGQITF